MSYAKKCYCTQPLRPDGTCRFGCDPALRKPSWRVGHVNQLLRKREKKARTGYEFPTHGEMQRANATVGHGYNNPTRTR